MNARETVMAAKTPREALLDLADYIDNLPQVVDSWDVPWGDEPDDDIPGTSPITIDIDEDLNSSVVLPIVSDEKKEKRREFARQWKLGDMLPELAGEIEEVYALGGPYWLYCYMTDDEQGRRNLFSYSEHMRRAMCQDLLEDDPVLAHEVSRDLLKSMTFETADDYSDRRGELGLMDLDNG